MREADLLRAVKTLWDSTGTMTTLVPGGLHEGRVPETVDSTKAYASVKVAAGDPEWTSGSAFLQRFTLTIMAWAKPNAGIVNATEGAAPIQATLDRMISRDRKGDLIVAGARVVDIRLLPGELREDEATKEASDVYLAGAVWDVLLQADKR